MQSLPRVKRIAVLGAGAVVRECFLPAFEALSLLDRVTIIDGNPGMDALRSRYTAARFVCADYRTWLSQCDENDYFAAVIALPNVCHEHAVRLAFDRGLHVLCEKPLTLSSQSCLDLAERAGDAGCVLAVNMIRRLYPSVSLARFAVEHGLIGRLESVDIRHGSAYSWPAETLAPFRPENGGLLADMGVHYLDLAESLSGELSPCHYEDDSRGGVEADLSYTLRSINHVKVRLSLSRVRTLTNRIVLIGDAGRAEFSVDDLTGCTVTDPSGTRIELARTEPITTKNLRPTFASCFAQQLENFLSAAQGDPVSFVDGFDASRTVAHIEWAYSNRASRPTNQIKCRPTASPAGLDNAPVLVTGATGFIGSHLIEELSARGLHEITALVRGPRNCASIARFPIQMQTANLLDYDAVRQAARGKRYVFHLAYGRDGKRRRDTTVEGTRNVVNAAIAEGCEAVVVVSTAYVFGWPSSTVDESAPYKPTGGEYGKSKTEMERWCLRAASASGSTRIVVLNPSCVYGPRGATYSELPVSLAKHQGFCWIDGGTGSANYTFVSNVIDAMLLGAANPIAHGERFIINDGTTTWRQFLSPILEPWLPGIPSRSHAELVRMEAGRRKGLVEALQTLSQNPDVRRIVRETSVGAAAANLVRRIGKAVPNGNHRGAIPLTGRSDERSGIPPSWLADLFPNHATRFSSERATRVLGWAPKVDLAEGQRRTIEYLRYIRLYPAEMDLELDPSN
jgi:nucleoside-diphosphate-sugar epimerase/predicted dehydrogenase